VIPLRSASQRVPEKIFVKIQGRELLLRMAEHALFFQKAIPHLRSHLAVDSERAVSLLAPYERKLTVQLTDPQLPSGTDRVCEVVKRLSPVTLESNEWILNVQGDMPFLCRESLSQFIRALADVPEEFEMATLAEPFQTIEDYRSPGVVKVLLGNNGGALYFSRLPIPYGRESLPNSPRDLIAWSHIGVYAYRARSLLKLASMAPHKIEAAEGLEQLRALASGLQIFVRKTEPVRGKSFRGIDLPADLEWAQRFAANP
jgi:3-deoxy-manno-octulosonate cytidylyltransferase (CMP-KDO synthetase)